MSYFLYTKRGHIAQNCPSRSINILNNTYEGQDEVYTVIGVPVKVRKLLTLPRLVYDIVQDMFNQRAEITYGQLLQYPDY